MPGKLIHGSKALSDSVTEWGVTVPDGANADPYILRTKTESYVLAEIFCGVKRKPAKRVNILAVLCD